MKISCCWLYAITKYGYPPSIEKTFTALKEMKSLGFENVELEGVRRDNLLAVYEKRHELKKLCDDEGLRVINFCPVLPGSVSLDRREREESWELFERALEIAKQVLAPGGNFVGKLFQGPDFKRLTEDVRKAFTQQKTAKPESSRQISIEQYVIGKGFKP